MNEPGFAVTDAEIATDLIKMAFGAWSEIRWQSRGRRHVSRRASASVGGNEWVLYEKDGRVRDARTGALVGRHPEAPKVRMDTRSIKRARKRMNDDVSRGW